MTADLPLVVADVGEVAQPLLEIARVPVSGIPLAVAVGERDVIDARVTVPASGLGDAEGELVGGSGVGVVDDPRQPQVLRSARRFRDLCFQAFV